MELAQGGAVSLCVIAGATTLRLAVAAFTLAWTHSVERTPWVENWRVAPAGLELVEARVKGSGAGMEPGPDARLIEGWWVWRPQLAPLKRLRLAGSAATPDGWALCAEGRCLAIGRAGDEAFAYGAELAPCD